jgi:hypothetical protein
VTRIQDSSACDGTLSIIKGFGFRTDQPAMLDFARDFLPKDVRGRFWGWPQRPCTCDLSLATGLDNPRRPHSPSVVPVSVNLKCAGKLGNPALPGL